MSMPVFDFTTTATREQAKARIGLQGPPGSGKTMSALRMAGGLAQGGRVAVIDTERGSAIKYAPVTNRPDLGGFVFSHIPMDTHDPRILIQAVRQAEAAGVAVLIVDSWSHFWNGKGGLLEIVEQAGRKPGAGGTFGGWREGNPIEQDMLDALLNFRGHLIVTLRTKTDYALEGTKVKKLGVKTIQREGTEYELDVVMDMAEGTATVTKTRYSPLTGETFHHPGEDVAEIILEQLGQGVDPVQLILDELTGDGLTYQRALELHGDAARRRLLDAPMMHPGTGAPAVLGEVIKEYGSALRPVAAVPDPTPPTAGSDTTEAPATVSPPREEPVQQPPAEPAGDRAKAEQKRAMFALFRDCGIGGDADRAERLRVSSVLVGRELGSANDLTRDEAKLLLDALTDASEQADPAAALAALVADAAA